MPPDVMLVVAPAVLPLEICNELRTVELFVAARVMVEALLLRLMPAPAINETLDDEPFREKAPPPAGPMIWILLAPVETVMFAPPEMTIVPVDEAKPFA